MAVPKHRATITVRKIRNNIKISKRLGRKMNMNELAIYNLAYNNEITLGKYNNVILDKLKDIKV